VPPFAEEVAVAKLPEIEEPAEVEVAEEPEVVEEPQFTPASRAAGRRSQDEVLREAGLAGEEDGARNGAPGEVAEDRVIGASGDGERAPKRPQGSQKRRQRQRRRKHGRQR
jgi:hypothetical protein